MASKESKEFEAFVAKIIKLAEKITIFAGTGKVPTRTAIIILEETRFNLARALGTEFEPASAEGHQLLERSQQKGN